MYGNQISINKIRCVPKVEQRKEEIKELEVQCPRCNSNAYYDSISKSYICSYCSRVIQLWMIYVPNAKRK